MHAHLILGNFHEGRALKDHHSAWRLEKVARLAEHKELNEPPTLGRGHGVVVRALEKSAPETAAWLVAAFGENPEKPRAAYSSETRNHGKRLGVNVPKARAKAQQLWARCSDVNAFRKALDSNGLEIAEGKKPGVGYCATKRANLRSARSREF